MIFVFFQGVLCGVILAVSLAYISLWHWNRKVLKYDEEITEHKMSQKLLDIGASSRDGWLNHLIHFLYREFQHSDSLHNFALKKMVRELDEIRNGAAKNILSKLDLHSYNFGSEFPVVKNFRLTEPEGFDPDDLPNSIAIDLDISYDASSYDSSERTPFQVSTIATINKLLNSRITVTIKVFKVRGRMRIRLSRDPSPYWYASFVEQPKLDIKISTDLNTRYATMIEDLFSRHLERMIMKRHVVPKFKVRYSPFFSNEYFKFKTENYDHFDFNYCSRMSVTVLKGRSFALKYADACPPSSCFVSLVLSKADWKNTLSKPRNQFNETQTEDIPESSAEAIVDDFINISVSSNKNSLIAEDELEAEVDDPSFEQEKIQVASQSKRTRILAFGSKVKEMAKEKVKEKIEPVIKHRRRFEYQAVNGTPNSVDAVNEKNDRNLTEAPPQNLGPPTKTELKDAWNVISAQKEFYRTQYSPSVDGNYQWKLQTFHAKLSPDVRFLLLGVWEKQNGKNKPTLVGQTEIDMHQIFAKSSQLQNKSFIRKIHLSSPLNLCDLSDRVDHILSENRGFKENMSFGELVLKILVTTEDAKENIIENNTTQTDEIIPDNSKRNIVGNIKKLWNKGEQKTIPDRSQSESQLTDSLNQTRAKELAPKFMPSVHSDDLYDTDSAETMEGIEIGTSLDEKDQHLYEAANYSGLAAKNQHDMLAAFAKEEGKSLHRDLPDDERRSEIEYSIAKIEREIDAEISRKNAIEHELKNPVNRAKTEISLQKCKDRLDSLTMLQMQCQSGMEDVDSPRNTPD